MALKLIWTGLAIEGFEEVLEYIELRFGLLFAKKYAARVQDILFNLCIMPHIGTLQKTDR